MTPITMDELHPGLVLDTSDDFLRSDEELTDTATEPVTPVDSVIQSPTPQIFVTQGPRILPDSSESHRRLSLSSKHSDIQYCDLPTPKKTTFGLLPVGNDNNNGQGVMLRWMKSLRGKSKLPHMHYDIYRAQTPRDSVHGNLSIAPSAMTSATGLTTSTNFVQRISTATASRISLSYYGSVAGLSRQDTFDHVDVQIENSLEDVLDIATIERAQQRWKILAEIVMSEEAYMMDIKTMISAFASIKDNVSSTDARTKKRIVDNMNDLLEYQEDFLSEIFTSLPASIALPSKPSSINPRFSDVPISGYDNLADPSLVKSLADVFESRMGSFFAHIEYGANYEKLKAMVHAYSTSSQGAKGWESGFEMLANALSAECNKGNYIGKKAATMADLIIKPIHHICRYPLLLSRLLEVTPTIDAPEANESLQRIIRNMKDLGSDLNAIQANVSGERDQLEKTWLLREIITLPREIDGLSDCTPHADQRKIITRDLGKVLLCGVLQVAYSTNDGSTARYTIGILYRTHLLLARPTVDPATQKAVCAVMFMIPLSSLKSDDIQDRSLPDAEFSWKIIFRKVNRLYKIRLSAKTAEDAEVWRSSLSNCIDRIATDSTATVRLSYLPTDIRSRENRDKPSVFDLKGQFSQAKSQMGLTRARSQPLGMFSIDPQEESAEKTKPSLEQQTSDKSLEKFLRRNADLERFLTDRKEEAVSRLWPEQRQTLEKLYSHVISTDILSCPGSNKERGRIQALSARSMSASYIEDKGLMRKLSITSIWQSRKRSYTPSNLDGSTSPKFRPPRIIIPERSSSLKPPGHKSNHSPIPQMCSMPFGRSFSLAGGQSPDEDDKENWMQTKSPSRTRSFLNRLSPEKHSTSSSSSTEASTPNTTAPVSPVTQKSSFSDKSREVGLSGLRVSGSSHSLASMQGRFRKSFRSGSGFKKFFAS